MTQRSHRVLLPSALLALLVAGCGAGGDLPQATDSDASDLTPSLKIRDGSVTADRPEVGRISGCTATLVAPDVAITASHCLGYRTANRLGRYDTFRVDGPGGAEQFTVGRYRSFGRDLGANNIALVGLSEMVPPDVAVPAPLAAEVPPDGAPLSVWGYGCTQLGRAGDGRKRSASFEQGEVSYHLCEGDSGGPVFDDDTGAVLRINSGYMLDRGRSDIYGIVPGLYDELLAQIEEWTRGEIPQAGGWPEGVDPDTEICGSNVDSWEAWTCTADRSHRYRCVPGDTPTWQPCDQGCVSSARGLHDACASPQAPDLCGDTYRDLPAWTCTADAATLVRCQGGELEIRACAGGCSEFPGEDRCD